MKNLKILSKNFYSEQLTIDLAKSLLGKYLVRELSGTVLIGKINEVEAYIQNDSAGHSFVGKTQRTQALFQEAGTTYVYRSYGIHWSFDIVSEGIGIAESILIRGVEPILGIDYMKRNRQSDNLKNLTNGPGKVTQAFSIDKSFYGHKIWEPPLYIAEAESVSPELIKSSPRVGISKNKDAMLRFYI